jgi:hypothetical protein
MGKVINFADQVVRHRGHDAKHSIAMRKMNKWYFRNRRGMQERDEKRNRQDELSEEHSDQ